MKRFLSYIKQHSILLTAAGLPVLVAVLALGFNSLSRCFVDLPKYSFLFTLMPKYEQPVRYYIENGELGMLLDNPAALKTLDKTLFPKLYVYDTKTQKSKELVFDVEPLIQKIRSGRKLKQKIDVKNLEKMKLLSGREAPDGYRIIAFDNVYMVDSKAIIFNLTKKGHVVKVPYPAEAVDFGHRATFVGWIQEP